MDWQALGLSLKLACITTAILLPIALLLGRWLAVTSVRFKPVIEAFVVLPLVLPPTVLGFYLLSSLGPQSWAGQIWERLFGASLVFSFQGLVVASVLINLPFAVQPAQRAFESIGSDLRQAAATCGLNPWRAFWKIEWPLALPGVLTGAILAFAHTLGEFGVVLMVGGAIPGETKTLALSIYDRVQALDMAGAGLMAGGLLAFSMLTVTLTFLLSKRPKHVGA